MSIEEILGRAWTQIQHEHGVAMTEVRFDLIDASTPAAREYVAEGVRVEGFAVRPAKGNE